MLLRGLLPYWELIAIPEIQELMASLRNTELRIGSMCEGILKINDIHAFDEFVISEFAFFCNNMQEFIMIDSSSDVR